MTLSIPAVPLRPKNTGRLCSALLCLLLLGATPLAVAADRTSDEYLTGYTASIIERDLHWQRDSYVLTIVNGVATITLFAEDPARRADVDKQLRSIDGLQRITVVVRPAHTEKPGGFSGLLGITGETKAFPTGDLFLPLIADPKQPQFFVGITSFTSTDVDYIMAAVGFGETFGLYRFFGSKEGNGLQLSLEAGVFAQFDMESESSDLINADYTIGFPLTYRFDDNSIRFRLYHQSSHLGDELLLGTNPPDRVNLSYESFDLLYSREYRGWRLYAGGEYLVHKEPDDLLPLIGHGGLEYRGTEPVLWGGRFVAGVDLKSMEEHDWAVDASYKAGLEFGHPNPGQRRLRVMAEYYDGYDPHGQFYNNQVEYYGLGVSLGF